MAYFICESKTAAEERSRLAWEETLGRRKRPEDKTEFLWPRTKAGRDGRVALIVADQTRLTVQERALVVPILDVTNWSVDSRAG